MYEGYQPADQAAAGQAVREGRASLLPTRVPTAFNTNRPIRWRSLSREGRAARLPVHMPSKDTPVDALVQAVREGRAAEAPPFA